MIHFLEALWRKRAVSAPPRLKPEPTFAFCAVSFNRASPEDINAEWTASIMRQIANGRFFEIRY